MDTVTIQVMRYDPNQDGEPRLQQYEVPTEKGATVLQALMHIYEEQDSSLAFNFGCRYRYCGLCSLEVDDKPCLSCLTPLKDGQVIKPLRHLPVLRDLVLDRAWVFDSLRDLQMFVPEVPSEKLPERVFETIEHRQLMQCTDCLICQATCPHYDHRDPSFGGTFTFVKLAQLHFDPRDQTDRVAQAQQLGIERCAACRKCYCPIGIPAWKSATSVLLKGSDTDENA
jgi:succinate dehydrogenase/fumarate reductase iron-sulfur protein